MPTSVGPTPQPSRVNITTYDEHDYRWHGATTTPAEVAARVEPALRKLERDRDQGISDTLHFSHIARDPTFDWRGMTVAGIIGAAAGAFALYSVAPKLLPAAAALTLHPRIASATAALVGAGLAIGAWRSWELTQNYFQPQADLPALPTTPTQGAGTIPKITLWPGAQALEYMQVGSVDNFYKNLPEMPLFLGQQVGHDNGYDSINAAAADAHPYGSIRNLGSIDTVAVLAGPNGRYYLYELGMKDDDTKPASLTNLRERFGGGDLPYGLSRIRITDTRVKALATQNVRNEMDLIRADQPDGARFARLHAAGTLKRTTMMNSMLGLPIAKYRPRQKYHPAPAIVIIQSAGSRSGYATLEEALSLVQARAGDQVVTRHGELGRFSVSDTSTPKISSDSDVHGLLKFNDGPGDYRYVALEQMGVLLYPNGKYWMTPGTPRPAAVNK